MTFLRAFEKFTLAMAERGGGKIKYCSQSCEINVLHQFQRGISQKTFSSWVFEKLWKIAKNKWKTLTKNKWKTSTKIDLKTNNTTLVWFGWGVFRLWELWKSRGSRILYKLFKKKNKKNIMKSLSLSTPGRNWRVLWWSSYFQIIKLNSITTVAGSRCFGLFWKLFDAFLTFDNPQILVTTVQWQRNCDFFSVLWFTMTNFYQKFKITELPYFHFILKF